jgi:hypothetical protein
MAHSDVDTELSGRLVRVFSSPRIPEGLLAKGLLEANGIAVFVKGESEGPYRMGPIDLWVPEEFELQARLVLEGAAEPDDRPER